MSNSSVLGKPTAAPDYPYAHPTANMQVDADPPGAFPKSLAHLRALPVDTPGLPSHGLRDRIDERLAQPERSRLEPRRAAEAMPGLFTRNVDDQRLFFALGETTAHLSYLMHRNRLARRPGKHGEHRFAATTDATRPS